MVDEILSDTKMTRMDRIEKLEAVLNSVIASSHDLSSNERCNCCCHNNDVNNYLQTSNVECQTVSTGDIVITNIFYEQDSKELNNTFLPATSKKK